ncbi:polysaccharide deacetylase family protein [Halomonas sp. A29]|uniref:polysaccharide deacetylase family protein n=1 Tax=Halomonas sp. A29 TaxID=3102786 RepID=UPI00398B039A
MTALYDRNSQARPNASPTLPGVPESLSVVSPGATSSEPVLAWLERVLQERFGLPLHLERDGPERLYLRHAEAQGHILFDRLQPGFYLAGVDLPHCQWDATEEGLSAPLDLPLPAPGAASLPRPLVETVGEGLAIHYDILGLTYWMLSRLEEVDAQDLDRHGRFPASASHAGRHGYLERPVVDEWLAVLGQVIRRQWPQVKLRRHEFNLRPTHDVDRPSRYGFARDVKLARVMLGDALLHRRPQALLLGPWVRLRTRSRLHPLDPLNTFDWLMDVSERYGLTSAFYFICGRTDPRKDADYEPEHPAIRHLMRRIHERGHEVGLHPSYHTFRNPKELANEAGRLRRVCAEEGIEQAQWGGRMHYLRWQMPLTLQGYEQAGLDYDTTLSYAEAPGFRCGTCFDYPAFDPVKGEPLALRIRPLIAMEASVISPLYLGLGTGEEAFERFSMLKERCRAVNGTFTLLWHNSELTTSAQRELYERVLRD